VRLLHIAALMVFLSSAMSCTSAGKSVSRHMGKAEYPGNREISARMQTSSNTLKVLTLNVAHGRKDARNQLFVDSEAHKRNLTDIANLLQQHDVHIAALQEADGPSRWSGDFDHVEFVARQAEYPWWIRADHARSWLFSYGTAILSRWPVLETVEHTFKPTPPTQNKGFLLGEVAWKLEPQRIVVDVVSVHLDFSRKSAREQQVFEMVKALEGRENPLIVLGDFNSDWSAGESVLKALAEEAKLKAYQPEADNLHTYGSSSRRLDWIFISDELEFVEYDVLPDVVSDHFAVVATIGLAESRGTRE